MINNFYTEQYLTGQSSEKIKKKILIIPEKNNQKLSPCFYIRIFNPYINREILKNYQIIISDIDKVDISDIDLIITHRIPYDNLFEAKKLREISRENRVKIIYDIDDNLLEINPEHLEFDKYKYKTEIVRFLIQEADIVTVSTMPLKLHFEKINKNIIILENYINFSKGKFPKKNTEKTGILYMGTYTHNEDLLSVLPSLNRLYSEGYKFILYLIGITNYYPNYRWIKVIDVPKNLDLYPHFTRWLKKFEDSDIGIAPLVPNDFNNSKSPIKYWDYTSMGLITFASNCPAYSSIIKNKINGFLVNNTEDSWYLAFKDFFKMKEIYKNTVENALENLIRKSSEINGQNSRLEIINKFIR